LKTYFIVFALLGLVLVPSSFAEEGHEDAAFEDPPPMPKRVPDPRGGGQPQTKPKITELSEYFMKFHQFGEEPSAQKFDDWKKKNLDDYLGLKKLVEEKYFKDELIDADLSVAIDECKKDVYVLKIQDAKGIDRGDVRVVRIRPPYGDKFMTLGPKKKVEDPFKKK
jgi:hypothetical protein